MREHMGLYRGKRIDNGEWVEGSFLQCGEARRPLDRPDIQFSDCYIVPKTDHDIVRLVGTNTVGLDIWAYHVDPDTVGECTGLRDKNGKLIFEGDIIENIDGRSIVFYDKTLCGFYMRFLDAYDETPLDMGEMWDDTKIIGNIHDNPELLKGGEQ